MSDRIDPPDAPAPHVQSPPALPVGAGGVVVDPARLHGDVDDEPRAALHRLAEQLMRDGNRRALVEYLRLRRVVQRG